MFQITAHCQGKEGYGPSWPSILNATVFSFTAKYLNQIKFTSHCFLCEDNCKVRQACGCHGVSMTFTRWIIAADLRKLHVKVSLGSTVVS